MRHESIHFSSSGLCEWLFYFRTKFDGFEMTMLLEDGQMIVGHGNWKSLTSRHLEFSTNDFGKPTSLCAKSEKTASWQRRMFGTAPLTGIWTIAGVQVGSCRMDPFDGKRIVELRGDSIPVHMIAAKSDLSAVLCPLIVTGIENCEMVLEDYLSLSKKNRAKLPDNPPKETFAGSCRSLVCLTERSQTCIEAIGLMVAMVELLVRPSFMRVDA